MSKDNIDIQQACKESPPVSQSTLKNWINTTLSAHELNFELTLRLVDIEEMVSLNTTYRKQNKPTNVLAFPSDLPENIAHEYAFLGDVVICPQVLQKEAEEQGLPLDAHWAHIIIHGVLHLLGYDHQEEEAFGRMKAMEIHLLSELGFSNPYQED